MRVWSYVCGRVDAVQQALVSVTGISTSDQIVMCHGARLDPAKPLAAYKLPVVSFTSSALVTGQQQRCAMSTSKDIAGYSN